MRGATGHTRDSASPGSAWRRGYSADNGAASNSGWVRPSITIPVRLLAGNNTVRVLGGIVAPVTTGWLGDSALVIQ